MAHFVSFRLIPCFSTTVVLSRSFLFEGKDRDKMERRKDQYKIDRRKDCDKTERRKDRNKTGRIVIK